MESRPDRVAEPDAVIAALRGERDRFRAMIECIPAAAWIKDLDGRYLWINRRFADAHGFDPGRVLGRVDDELFPPEVVVRRRADDAPPPPDRRRPPRRPRLVTFRGALARTLRTLADALEPRPRGAAHRA